MSKFLKCLTVLFLMLFVHIGLCAQYKYFEDKSGFRLAYDAKFAANTTPGKQKVIIHLHGYCQQLEQSDMFRQAMVKFTKKDVWSIDWLGAGYSDRLVPAKSQKYHIDNYMQYITNLKSFINDVIKPYYKKQGHEDIDVYIFGASMGGAIALRFLQLNPNFGIKHLFSFAPMLSFNTRAFPKFVINYPLSLICFLGFNKCFAFSEKANFIGKFTTLKNSSSMNYALGYKRYKIIRDKLIVDNRNTSGATFGWVREAARLGRDLSKDIKIDIKTPCTFYMADDERVVMNELIEHFGAEMNNVELIKFNNTKHGINFASPSLWKKYLRI